ncbi:Haemagglutinin [Actinobacillus equuli]|nr:Haemagglutinin [Actinobacillus equuli]
MGSKGNERRVTNVARGVQPTDAVNKAQLDEVKGDVGQIKKTFVRRIANFERVLREQWL